MTIQKTKTMTLPWRRTTASAGDAQAARFLARRNLAERPAVSLAGRHSGAGLVEALVGAGAVVGAGAFEGALGGSGETAGGER
jgi:hypothetical protein